MMEDIEILIGFLCKNKLRKIGEVILIPNFRRPKERVQRTFFWKKKRGRFYTRNSGLNKQWNEQDYFIKRDGIENVEWNFFRFKFSNWISNILELWIGRRLKRWERGFEKLYVPWFVFFDSKIEKKRRERIELRYKWKNLMESFFLTTFITRVHERY